jgi:hypothetical protein
MHALQYLKNLPAERFVEIYSGLEVEGYGPLDREVAQSLKFRPQAIGKLPMAQRAKRAKQIIEKSANEELAYEILGAWLLRHKKALVTGFLDATGVAHQDGMIEDIGGVQPDAAKVADAVAVLDQSFGKDPTTMYLVLCKAMWPDNAGVSAALAAR